MPKAKHAEHGQSKVDWVRARITPDGKDGLERLAESYQISLSEFLERLGRGQINLATQSVEAMKALGEPRAD
jgi:hypothetical protein